MLVIFKVYIIHILHVNVYCSCVYIYIYVLVRQEAHHDRDLAILALHVLDQLRQRQGRLVPARHVQPLVDHLVELRLAAARQELVELAQEPQVRVPQNAFTEKKKEEQSASS